MDGSLRVVLAMLFQASLALDELFAIEVCEAVEDRLWCRLGVGKEPR
jgi:hypothetical protein